MTRSGSKEWPCDRALPVAGTRRIQLELEELERTQRAIQKHWQTARRTATDQDAYLNSVALNLHSFYSALERIFELIALELDGGTLGGETWHTELLRQMSLDVPDVRPPVLQTETTARLDEYRKFRHRIRNIYATNLDPWIPESNSSKLLQPIRSPSHEVAVRHGIC